ncbi:acyl-CoA thioesterase [Pusillimonas sp. TS35]|uniref:acyl-CoA thioesterase n=1 Tax=Paracandidimonas lactea TaxID=2895524 RepID=UPI001368A1D3|nr:thioesterase family protein [Paracandidimonas lactea]MYN13919.1 acyl-CoA thioesterase [Pusillimonas sp. TS35]
MKDKNPPKRTAFKFFLSLGTRWMDNDVYGHVNNVTYYSYFDTVVNRYLVDNGLLDIARSQVIGLVVETGCRYFSSVAFPDTLDIGLKVAHLGNSSVRYEIGVFKQGEEAAAACGHFVHVYVDRETRKPTPLPAALRETLGRIMLVDAPL